MARMVGLDLGQILGSMHGGDEERNGNGYNVTIQPEAQIAEMREQAKDYADTLIDCRFKVGDLITPKSIMSIKGCGAPHIVVEVRKAEPYFSPRFGDGSSGQGNRNDVRVLCYISNDNMVPFWVESWQYEPYVGELKSDEFD